MTPEERLELLFEGDQAHLDLNTHLNEYQPETDEPKPAPSAPHAAVSAPQTHPQCAMLDSSDPMSHSPGEPCLSYIRTRVIGLSATDGDDDDDNHVIQPLQSPFSSSKEDIIPAAKSESALPSLEEQTKPDPAQVPIDTSQASLASSFCPAIAMARFPYKYIRGDLSQSVASQFFDGNKFWNRDWDLYYLNVPREASNHPLLLLPAMQAQVLLEEINQAHNCTLSLTRKGQNGLLLPFDDDGTPRPVYLGRSSSRGTKDQLEGIVPMQPGAWNNWLQDCDPNTASVFRQTIEAGISTTKNKPRGGKAAQEKREQRRVESAQKWARYLRQTEAHFGMLSITEDGNVSSDEFPPVNVNVPAPWPFLDSPIFISLDVEWNERSPTQITEVGISVLDTLDLKGVAPGDYGELWRKQIRSKHLRVLEYLHVINREYCYGCPDQFDFGDSEIITRDAVGAAVDVCFSPPYLAVPDSKGFLPTYKTQMRKVILVGHNPAHDIQLLRDEGSKALSDDLMPNRILDTAELYRSLRSENESRSLRFILGGLGILALHLHNAGNDARFTMEGLVRIVLDAAGERPGAYEKGKVTCQDMEEVE